MFSRYLKIKFSILKIPLKLFNQINFTKDPSISHNAHKTQRIITLTSKKNIMLHIWFQINVIYTLHSLQYFHLISKWLIITKKTIQIFQMDFYYTQWLTYLNLVQFYCLRFLVMLWCLHKNFSRMQNFWFFFNKINEI